MNQTGRGWRYHKKGCNDPIQEDAKRYLYPDLSCSENVMERLELDLAQYRIHHDQQTDS